jgi:hypothetical protein
MFPAVRRAPIVARPQVNGTGQVIRLRRRGFWLEYASMAWMTAEPAVAITAGVIASSVALVGFVPVANGPAAGDFLPWRFTGVHHAGWIHRGGHTMTRVKRHQREH